MPLTTVAINGVPIEDYGIGPIALEEWLAPPRPKYGEVSPVGRMGSIATVRGLTWEPRRLRLGVQTTNATATTLAAGRLAVDAWHKALQGLLEVETIDAPGRVCYGVFEGGAVDTFGIKLLSPLLQSVGEIVCRDPRYFDRSPVSVSAAAATRVAIPVGSAPGVVKIIVYGAATNPTVTLRDRNGATIAQMRFTVTLGATESLVIDPRATWPVTKMTAGVASDAFSTLNILDTLLTVDPLDEPTVETSTGTIQAVTWRGYLS